MTAFRRELVGFCVCLFLSVGCVMLCFYLLYDAPVLYTRLITEDNWAEFATAVCFAIAGVLLILLSRRSETRLQRIVWIVIGLAAIFIAGEEISWGQHIFKWHIPEELRKINYQRETNIHNLHALYPVQRKLSDYLSYVIVGWSIFSSVLLLRFPQGAKRLHTYGIPLIPFKLVPVFLMAPYFFKYFPNFRADEIGELFLGIAAAVWVLNLFLLHGLSPKGPLPRFRSVLATTGMLLAIGLFSALLTHQFSGWPNGRILDQMAFVYYAPNGLYDQALELYEYIYAHPDAMHRTIPTHYGTVLLRAGNKEEAEGILSAEARKLEGQDPPERKRGEHLRRLVRVHALLENEKRADLFLDEVVTFEMEKAQNASSDDEKASSYWNIALAYEARGDVPEAIRQVDRALEVVSSPYLRSKFERWRSRVMKAGSASDDYADVEE